MKIGTPNGATSITRKYRIQYEMCPRYVLPEEEVYTKNSSSCS
jgi:hypothetical protein